MLLWAWPSCGHSLSQSTTRADPGEKERKEKKRKRRRKKKSKIAFARYGASAYPGGCPLLDPRRYDSNQMLCLWSNSKSWNIDITWQWDFFGALEIIYDTRYSQIRQWYIHQMCPFRLIRSNQEIGRVMDLSSGFYAFVTTTYAHVVTHYIRPLAQTPGLKRWIRSEESLSGWPSTTSIL